MVGAKNDVAIFADLPLTGLEFDNRKIALGLLFVTGRFYLLGK
ncbi:hypothetical protein ABID29_000680 [Streptococcus rupicaprae]|uniref:Uncharacterized protein n=1 Tax=Streptococcus rupicaprae TaxID=759619 RepID=A0ABV2FGL0_9STRE